MMSEQQFPLFMLLPEHLQVKIMCSCDSTRTLLNLASTCSELYQLLITTHILSSRLKLSVKFSSNVGDNVNMLTILLQNSLSGRKYSKMRLTNIQEAKGKVEPLMMKVLALIGGSVKELEVASSRVKGCDLISLTQCFKNVSKLSLNNLRLEETDTETDKTLPALKDLTVHDTSSTVLRLFERHHDLHRFKLHLHARESYEMDYKVGNLENFLISQKQLKILELSRLHKNCLFQNDRLDEIKFQLDSVTANKIFLHSKHAAKFFKQQKSLRTVKLSDFYDVRVFSTHSEEYIDVMHTIFTLPQLQSIGIFNHTIELGDFQFFAGLTNNSVTELEYDLWNGTIFERLLNMFPNLKKISFRCFTVKLREVPSKMLALMHTSGSYNLEEFSFQPSHVQTSREHFERNLLDFIRRNPTIQHLTLGAKTWFEDGFRITLACIIEILYLLPSLADFIVYNPCDIRLLAMLLLRGRNSLNSVTIYTDEAGKASTQGMDRKWLKIMSS